MSDPVPAEQAEQAETAEKIAARCPNCGAAAPSRYCAECGQDTRVDIPTVGALIGEFLDGAFNLDSRIWRTLVPLILRPGFLTLEYVAGRRARYVAPVRLYLVLSLIFFAISSTVGGTDVASALSDDGELPTDVTAQCAWVDEIFGPTNPLNVPTHSACERAIADGGQTLLNAFIDRISLMIFIMVPLFAAGLKLLYAFTGRRFAEHLFFLFHVHAFVFATATISNLLGALEGVVPMLATPVSWATFAIAIYWPVYGYLALRRFYRQSRWLTVLKYVALAFGYAVLLGLTFMAGFVYTAYTV